MRSELVQSFESKTPKKQKKMVQELADQKKLSDEIKYLFLHALHSHDPSIQWHAVRGLRNYPEEDNADSLLNCLKHNKSDSIRAIAAETLGRFIYKGFYLLDLKESLLSKIKKELIACYKNPKEKESVRPNILRSLSIINNDKEIIKMIETAYKSNSKKLRLAALFSMGRNRLSRWNSILKSSLEGKNKDLVYAALQGCEDGKLSEMTLLIQNLCLSKDIKTAQLAMRAMWKIDGTTALAVIKENLKSKSKKIRTTAQRILDESNKRSDVAKTQETIDFEEDIYLAEPAEISNEELIPHDDIMGDHFIEEINV